MVDFVKPKSKSMSVDFIKPKGMSEDEADQLKTQITMNILLNTLSSMPPELVSGALLDSLQNEINERISSLQKSHNRSSVIQDMMCIGIAKNAYIQIQAELSKARPEKTNQLCNQSSMDKQYG